MAAAAAGNVVSKANMVSFSSSCSHSHQKETNKSGFSICVVAKGCKLRGFALKVKPLQAVLRSQRPLLGSSEFHGDRVLLHQGNLGRPRRQNSLQASIRAQPGIRIPNAQKWWEKGLQPNMKEVTSAHDLVDSLTNAGDKLVVLDFFSPGCGGCKALHPKICQTAGMNPNVQFLQVNHEEHKSMCYSLGIHVLPFFRFYRGAHGRLCSFSCTNATIKKFKDALAKHTPDRCSLGPTEGLGEKELLALAANKDLSFTYTPKPIQALPVPAQDWESTVQPQCGPESAPDPTSTYNHLENFSRLGGKTMVTSGR